MISTDTNDNQSNTIATSIKSVNFKQKKSNDGVKRKSKIKTPISIDVPDHLSYNSVGILDRGSMSPNSISSSMTLTSRLALEAEIREDPDSVSLERVIGLGIHCFQEGRKTVLRIRNLKLIRIGALLLEWVCNAGGVIPLSEQLKLATAHYEIWITSGMEVDSYHLKRARELFTVCVQWIPNVGVDVIILLTYSKILHYSGQHEKALNILEQILNKLSYDSNEANNMALQVTILMGVIKKSTGAHQEAYELFYSAFKSEEGQYCHLLKSDLLLIMARCFQESNMSCQEYSDEEVEDKYYAAFSAIEGNEDNSDSFDIWINNSNTWRGIGDKCRVLGYFSLAADLYGQGLVRDEDAYLYPRLWIGYAKTCVRCGRYSDAQLAVKQAISADPDNIKTFSILQKLLKPSSKFVPLANGPITDILDMLPRYEHKRNLAAARLQAFLRGVNARRLFRTGLRQPYSAHCQILVHGKYSILVRAESDLGGVVRYIQLYDTLMNVTGDDTGIIPLNSSFSPPMLLNNQSTASTTLGMSSRKEIIEQEVLIYNPDTNQDESVIREIEQFLIKLTYSGRNTDELTSLEIRLSFVDEFGLAPSISEDLSRPGSPDHRENLKTSILDFLVVDEKNTIKSTIVNCVVAKGVYRYEGHLFAYAVRNIEMYTIITLSESLCCRRLELRFVREYFGLSAHMPTVLKTIFRMIEVQPYLAAVLLGIEIEEQRARCGVFVENKLLFLDTMIDDSGAIVNVQSVNQLPVLTSRLEVIPSIVTEKIRTAVSIDLKFLVKRAKAVVAYREKTCAHLRLIGRRMKAFVELSETARIHRRNQIFHKLRHLATYSEAKYWLLQQASFAKVTIKQQETQEAIRLSQYYLKTKAAIAKSFLALKERATAAIGFLSLQDKAIHDLQLRGRIAQCYCYLHAIAKHAIFHCRQQETYQLLCSQAHHAKVHVRRQEVYNSLSITANDAKETVKREELRVAQEAAIKHLHNIAKQVLAYEDLVAFGKEARRTVPAIALHHIDGNDATYLSSVLYSSAMLVVSFAGKIGMDQALVKLEEMRIAKYNDDVDKLAGDAVLLLQDQLMEEAIQVAIEPDITHRTAISHSLATDLTTEVMGTAIVAEQGRQWGILQDTSQSNVANVLQVSVDIISELILRITRDIAEATSTTCIDESTHHETHRILTLSEEIYQMYMEEAVFESLWSSSTAVLLQERQEAEEERNRVEMSQEELRQQEYEEQLKACLLALEKVKKENEYKLEQEARERQENELGELAALVTIGGQRRPHSHNSVRPKMLVPQGSGKMRTAMFLAHQNKRMDAVDYLIDRAGTAVVFVTRKSAFEYLTHRAEVAKAILKQAFDEPETDAFDAGKRPPKMELKREASRRKNGFKDIPSPTHLTRSPSKRKLSLTSKYNPGMSHRQDSSIGLKEVFSDLPSLAPRDSDSSHSSSKSPGRRPLPTDPLESAEMLRELLAAQSPASLSSYDTFGGLDSGLPSYASDSYLFPPNSIYTATVLPPPKIATTKRNPVQFLANTEIRHADRNSYHHSIDSFKRMGYSNGECEYMETWQKRLEKCIEDFQPALRLDRAMSKLQHFHSEPISRSEALCAIAEADGCVEEAIGRLHDMDFMDEIRLVCSVLPVQQMVSDIGNKSETDSDLAGSTIDSPEAVSGDQKKLFQKRIGVKGPKTKPTGLRGSPSLPNIALSETSPAVLKRATIIPLRNTSASASLSNLPVVNDSDGTNTMPTTATNAPMKRPGAFLPDIPNNTPEMRNSTGRLPVPHKSHKPSIYLEKAIDNKIAETNTLVVMSRRDATLAKMEETLSRSGKYKKMKPTRNRKAMAMAIGGGKVYNDQS